MKKRLLPILLTLVLVCALPLGAVFVTSGDVTSALVSAAWAEGAEGEEGSGTAEVQFTEVDSEETLKAAVAGGESVRLTGDIEIKSALEVKSSLTLDLNGCVLSRVSPSSALKANFSMIQVKNGATLTLVDSGSTAVHKFKSDGQRWEKVSDNATGENIAVVNGGVIYGAVNSQIEDMSGIKIVSGTLEMRGGNIVGVMSDWSTCYGGGVYVSAQCTFNMYGGSIKGCYVSDDGGGVYVAAGGTFTMSGSSTIEGCNASSGGGVYNAGTFTMSGNSCIRNCIYRSGAGSGGVHSVGTFNLNGGSIVRSLFGYNNNKELVDICNAGTLNATIPVSCWVSNYSIISEGTFTGNFSNGSGGMISGGEFQGKVENCGTINGGTFSVGEVLNPGGSICNGTFKRTVLNSSGWIKGGDFYNTVTNEAIIEGGEFRAIVNNTCEIRGGEFYGTVNNDGYGRIGSDLSEKYDGGIFYGTVTGSGTINDKAYETVTFDSAGGTAVEPLKVLRGQTATEPATPTKVGYTFGGWFAEGATGAFNFTETPITASLTLTAQWTVCDHSDSENRPTCTTGVKCSVCAADLPAKGHSGGEATCAAKAKCSVCQAEYGDLEPNNHASLTHVLAAAATTKAEGNIEYWHCTGCGRYFSDAQAAEEITQADTVLAKLPPRYYYNSGAAAKPDSGKKNSPGTADPGVMLYGAAALLSLTGMAVLAGRKK